MWYCPVRLPLYLACPVFATNTDVVADTLSSSPSPPRIYTAVLADSPKSNAGSSLLD